MYTEVFMVYSGAAPFHHPPAIVPWNVFRMLSARFLKFGIDLPQCSSEGSTFLTGNLPLLFNQLFYDWSGPSHTISCLKLDSENGLRCGKAVNGQKTIVNTGEFT